MLRPRGAGNPSTMSRTACPPTWQSTVRRFKGFKGFKGFKRFKRFKRFYGSKLTVYNHCDVPD
jgi:hypothetical protein